jgi:hypothetical protein
MMELESVAKVAFRVGERYRGLYMSFLAASAGSDAGADVYIVDWSCEVAEMLWRKRCSCGKLKVGSCGSRTGFERCRATLRPEQRRVGPRGLVMGSPLIVLLSLDKHNNNHPPY